MINQTAQQKLHLITLNYTTYAFESLADAMGFYNIASQAVKIETIYKDPLGREHINWVLANDGGEISLKSIYSLNVDGRHTRKDLEQMAKDKADCDQQFAEAPKELPAPTTPADDTPF